MLSLADLRARNVHPVWQEAVAVVQELVQGALAADGSLPDLEHVALIPNGDVVALPGSVAEGNPVRHAALMLRVMLDGTPVPPELDAFVSRNTAEAPKCQDLGDFARNLSFFERPGRRADVERLVERAMAAEQSTRAEEELQKLKDRTLEATVSMQAPPEMFAVPERKRNPVLGFAVAAILLAVVVAVPVWWWNTRTVAPQLPVAPGAAAAVPAEAAPSLSTQTAQGSAEAPAAPGEAPAAGAKAGEPSFLDRTAAVLRSAMSRLVSAASPTEVIPAPAAEVPAPAAAPINHARRRRPIQTSPATAPAMANMAPRAPVSEPVRAAIVTPAADSVPAPVDETIYTRADATVDPPVLVRPVLPKEPPPGVPLDQIGTMEVVVDEQGDVEQVRLVSPANRFHERMLVSAAKTWKFRPAFKDGRAVRYRTWVRLTI